MARRLVRDPTPRVRPARRARRIRRSIVSFRCQDCSAPVEVPVGGPDPERREAPPGEPAGGPAPFHRLPCLRADHRRDDAG